LFHNVQHHTFNAPALGLFPYKIHIHIKPFVSVTHAVDLVVDESLTALVALGSDFDKSCHNFFVLIVSNFILTLQRYIKFYIPPNIFAKKYQKIYVFMVFGGFSGRKTRKTALVSQR
jgi:thiamine pyrophosphokinase